MTGYSAPRYGETSRKIELGDRCRHHDTKTEGVVTGIMAGPKGPVVSVRYDALSRVHASPEELEYAQPTANVSVELSEVDARFLATASVAIVDKHNNLFGRLAQACRAWVDDNGHAEPVEGAYQRLVDSGAVIRSTDWTSPRRFQMDVANAADPGRHKTRVAGAGVDDAARFALEQFALAAEHPEVLSQSRSDLIRQLQQISVEKIEKSHAGDDQ